MSKFISLMVLLIASSSAFAGTYNFGSISGWVDDYSGQPEIYDGIYSYQIYVDDVMVKEVIDAATPTVADVVPGPAGALVQVQLRNGNSQTPVGDARRYSAWTDKITVNLSGTPVPVTTWTFHVTYEK